MHLQSLISECSMFTVNSVYIHKENYRESVSVPSFVECSTVLQRPNEIFSSLTMYISFGTFSYVCEIFLFFFTLFWYFMLNTEYFGYMQLTKFKFTFHFALFVYLIFFFFFLLIRPLISFMKTLCIFLNGNHDH